MGVVIVRILGAIVTVGILSLYGIYFYRKGVKAGINETVIKVLTKEGVLKTEDNSQESNKGV